MLPLFCSPSTLVLENGQLVGWGGELQNAGVGAYARMCSVWKHMQDRRTEEEGWWHREKGLHLHILSPRMFQNETGPLTVPPRTSKL